MSGEVTLKVTGIAEDVTEGDLRAAFAIHGYVKKVTIVEAESIEPRHAMVTYAMRTAVEAVGDAIANFAKQLAHPCAADSSQGLTLKVDQDSTAKAEPAASAAPPPRPIHQPPPPANPAYGQYGMQYQQHAAYPQTPMYVSAPCQPETRAAPAP